MRNASTLAMACFVALTACESAPVLEPATAPSFSQTGKDKKDRADKDQRKACKDTHLDLVTSGEIAAEDCLFTGGGRDQFEDLFKVNQNRLGLPDRSGAQMLTFAVEADFDARYGIGGFAGNETFPTPVFGYGSFLAGATGAWGNSFSFIGSEPQYKMWVGGNDAAQLGSYTVTTSVEPSIDTCENGHWVFIQGQVSFTSDISNATACQGIIEFGPNAGGELRYQFWYVKLLPGETLTATLAGTNGHPTVVLAAIDFAANHAEIDFGDGPGDTDRTVTFTADRELYLYLEVSTAPGVSTGYTLTVDGP